MEARPQQFVSLAIEQEEAADDAGALDARKRAGAKALVGGLGELFQRGVLVDVALICGTTTFLAHKAVLASRSAVFRQDFTAAAATTAGTDAAGSGSPDGAGNNATGASSQTPAPSAGPPSRREVQLSMVSNPEAVQFMLDFMYDGAKLGSYEPTTPEVNKDVLRLAQNFKLAGLQDSAVQWLACGVTTHNVAERLAVCEEFGLTELLDEIAGQLVSQPDAFLEVASSAELRAHSELMRILLLRAATAAIAREVADKEEAVAAEAREAAAAAAAKQAALDAKDKQAALEAKQKAAEEKQREAVVALRASTKQPGAAAATAAVKVKGRKREKES